MKGHEYLELKDTVKDLQRSYDRLGGVKQQLMGQLKQEFGCKNLEAARKLLKDMKSTHAKLEEELEDSIADFEKEYADVLRELRPSRLGSMADELQAAQAKFDYATAAIDKEQEALKAAKRKVKASEKAQTILQAVAQAVQQEAQRQIASVVSRCLEAIFDEPYEFKITFERKRGKTEAVLGFVREGQLVDPLTASGGGVVDVAAFALRLACLVLTKPTPRRLLVLDEPMRFLSAEYRPRMRALLGKLAEEMDVQFIIVTHQQDMKIGKVVSLG